MRYSPSPFASYLDRRPPAFYEQLFVPIASPISFYPFPGLASSRHSCDFQDPIFAKMSIRPRSTSCVKVRSSFCPRSRNESTSSAPASVSQNCKKKGAIFNLWISALGLFSPSWFIEALVNRVLLFIFENLRPRPDLDLVPSIWMSRHCVPAPRTSVIHPHRENCQCRRWNGSRKRLVIFFVL